jgi:hypothetical protein
VAARLALLPFVDHPRSAFVHHGMRSKRGALSVKSVGGIVH